MERRALVFLVEEKHFRRPIFFITYRTVNERLQVVEMRFHDDVLGAPKKPF